MDWKNRSNHGIKKAAINSCLKFSKEGFYVNKKFASKPAEKIPSTSGIPKAKGKNRLDGIGDFGLSYSHSIVGNQKHDA